MPPHQRPVAEEVLRLECENIHLREAVTAHASSIRPSVS